MINRIATLFNQRQILLFFHAISFPQGLETAINCEVYRHCSVAHKENLENHNLNVEYNELDLHSVGAKEGTHNSIEILSLK